MSEQDKNEFFDVDAALKRMADETPDVPADFHASWVRAVREEAQKPGSASAQPEKVRRLSPQWTRLLGVAAVFVFLLGGTLLTRGKLRPAPKTGRTEIRTEAAEPAADAEEAEPAMPVSGAMESALREEEEPMRPASAPMDSALREEEEPAEMPVSMAVSYEASEAEEAAMPVSAPVGGAMPAAEEAEYDAEEAAPVNAADGMVYSSAVMDTLSDSAAMPASGASKAAEPLSTGMPTLSPAPEGEILPTEIPPTPDPAGIPEPEPEPADEGFLGFLKDFGAFTLAALPWMAGAAVLAGVAVWLAKRRRKG